MQHHISPQKIHFLTTKNRHFIKQVCIILQLPDKQNQTRAPGSPQTIIHTLWFLLLLAPFTSRRFFPARQNNLTFKYRNFHNLRKPFVFLTELLHLVSIYENTGPISEVKRMVAWPHIHHVLLLGPTCCQH